MVKFNRRELGEGATDNGAQKPSVYQEPTFHDQCTMFYLFHLLFKNRYLFYSAELSVQLSSQPRKKSLMSLRGKKKRSSNSTPLVLFFINFKVSSYIIAMNSPSSPLLYCACVITLLYTFYWFCRGYESGG